MILGIDPGNDQSGWCLIDVTVSPAGSSVLTVEDAGKGPNHSLRNGLLHPQLGFNGLSCVVIENMQSFGGNIGRTVLDTCIEIGRFVQICEQRDLPCLLIPRPEYARWMADGARKVNDSVLRQALMLRYGGDKKGEPLYLLKGATDKRSAFAVAAYAVETGQV